MMLHVLNVAVSGRKASAMLNKIILIVISFCVLVAAASLPAEAEEAMQSDDWEFTVAPYMWAASIGMTTASGSDVDIDFNDILDNLDMTFMGVFGVRKGKWSLLGDVIYLGLKKDDISYSSAIPVGPFGRSTVFFDVDADVEVTSWILTPAVAYTVIHSDKVTMDVVAGARYLYLKSDAKLNINAELDVQLINNNIVRTAEINKRIIESDHFWDGIVGIKGNINLNDKWHLPWYADVGTGDTDLTWQALGGIGYRFSVVDAIAGYRYMAWEFDDDAAFDDMDVSGPYVGFKFVF